MADQYAQPRRFPRLSVVLDCRIEGLSGRASVRLTELSVAGGYVDTNATFRVGDRVRFGMLLDGTEIPVTARVIYTHTGIGFGFTFEFDEMDPSARERIEELLRESGAGSVNEESAQ